MTPSSPSKGVGDSSLPKRSVLKLIVTHSTLVFVLGFLGIVTAASTAALVVRSPLFTSASTTFVATLSFVASAILATVLAAYPLLAGKPKLLTSSGRKISGTYADAGDANLLGPIFLALFFLVVSGQSLLSSSLLAGADYQLSVILVYTLGLGVPLLVTWSLFVLWLSFWHPGRLPAINRETERIQRGDLQKRLGVIPAAALLVILLVWVAASPPAKSQIVIDGRFADWDSIPATLLPKEDTEIRVEGLTAQYQFAQGGIFPLSLVLADGNRNLAFWNTTVHVPNRVPVPSFQVQIRNLTAFFDGSASTDPDGTVVGWDWLFGDGTSGSGIRVNHTYSWSGGLNVTLRVVDDAGGLAELPSPIRVSGPDHPPFARIQLRVVGAAVTAYGDGSYDPDGQVVNYTWQWGDGSLGYGETANHTYQSTNVYTVALQVRDDGGLAGNITTLVRVPNQVPVPDWSYTTSGPYVMFNATSSRDPDGSILSYVWSFGDGAIAQGVWANHTYSAPGTYAVVLAVTDDEGASATLVRDVSVPPYTQIPEPVVRLRVYTTGLLATADASESFDPGGGSLDYSWTFGDGSTAQGSIVQHLYSVPGAYLLGLRAAAVDGRTAETSTYLTVMENRTDLTPPVPVVHIRINERVVTLDASESTDADHEGLSATWIVHEARADLDLIETKGIVSADHLFLYFELGGAPLSPLGTYRVLLDTGDRNGFVRGQHVYSYELVVDPTSPTRVSLLRYAGGLRGFDEWAQIGSVPSASDGVQWETQVSMSVLLKPPSIGFSVESVRGTEAVDVTPFVRPYGG